MASLSAEPGPVSRPKLNPEAAAWTPAPQPASAASAGGASQQTAEGVGEAALPYGGDINAAMKAHDREGIRVIMEARKRGVKPTTGTAADAAAVVAAAAAAAEEEEGAAAGPKVTCPICEEERTDVQMLEHAPSAHAGGDISSHQACADCRAAMVRTGGSCPWCRSEIVWQNLFGFLDGLKDNIGAAPLCALLPRHLSLLPERNES